MMSLSAKNRETFRGEADFKDNDIPILCTSKNKNSRIGNSLSNKIAMSEKNSVCDSYQLRNNKVEKQSDDDSLSEKNKLLINEIKHVRKRIANIQESIQQSQSIVQPSIWKDNCLNAVINCVNEWRSVVSYHGKPSHIALSDNSQSIEDESDFSPSMHEKRKYYDESFPMHINNDWSLVTTLRLFGIIQMAMQSGPLKGSNPGYFKRCGVEVSSMAQEFLLAILKDDVEYELRFTSNQKKIMTKWFVNAQKAVQLGRPPSKSALKLQKSTRKESKKKKVKTPKSAST